MMTRPVIGTALTAIIRHSLFPQKMCFSITTIQNILKPVQKLCDGGNRYSYCLPKHQLCSQKQICHATKYNAEVVR